MNTFTEVGSGCRPTYEADSHDDDSAIFSSRVGGGPKSTPFPIFHTMAGLTRPRHASLSSTCRAARHPSGLASDEKHITNDDASGAYSTHYYFLFVVAYVGFGLLHELSHLAVAYWILPSFHENTVTNNPNGIVDSVYGVLAATARILLGRYCAIEFQDEKSGLPRDYSGEIWAITHAGWIFSWFLAFFLHYHQRSQQTCDHDQMHRNAPVNRSPLQQWTLIHPLVLTVAYIVAIEATVTDLIGCVPAHSSSFSSSADTPAGTAQSTVVFFCGNFGILLINSSWLKVDGGRTALDLLEKMVNVTMMRGAQSGGVVTFEPTTYSGTSTSEQQRGTPPALRGVRSRVVNAKRTDLSKEIRRKVVSDNCNIRGNVRGWNKKEYNNNEQGGGRLVRGFFGHTRFATSSKASFSGTHPHQWSPRRMCRMYRFDNNDDATTRQSTPQEIGVENYITHNGDFEFYKVNGKYYDVEILQRWLETTLGARMPATVDSAAIAGVVDLIRTQGSFALSARYALCLELGESKVDPDPAVPYPVFVEYEEIGGIFEGELSRILLTGKSLEDLSCNACERENLTTEVVASLRQILDTVPTASSFLNDSSSRFRGGGATSAFSTLARFVNCSIENGSLKTFVHTTVDAFFDNDLLHTSRLFLENAKGSFGLCITTSMDAHRQVCFAARGQTLSIAFYPRKGLICFGSEQAAVKAGLSYENPGHSSLKEDCNEADDAVRLDLDDLGGEICLLDWGFGGNMKPAISPPNREGLVVEKLMNDTVSVILLHQNNLNHSSHISKRLTLLENNEFIKPLPPRSADPVLTDIRDIPSVCRNIQEDWRGVGLNRMTAWNLAACIRARMQAHVDGKIENHAGQIDILVTGCEVSLWVAEHFVADLMRCFPKLFVKAVSSNKLLGLFGQELTMPCIGFPLSQKAMDMKDPIIIIVSHSGGTFGPLACSNLLQSFSQSIFVVTSEWDTQIGKQLRTMYSDDLLSSRIFSTEVGVRPAEPCSLSVVATHQLLTNILGHISLTIISDPRFRHVSGAVVTERDLQTLERCNQDNISALEEIVGVDRNGNDVHERRSKRVAELRAAGDVWAEHVLENAKAYIMSFIYIVGTVTSGYSLITGLAIAFGLEGDWPFYITRFLDSLIYFWLPQINVFILRLVQGRNLRHRMVGRTVVIADCPWVAQAADAFLSKIFACSYSIAGINVLHGNPADHLVHRHTHRVVRGTLLVCGRPDGRLTALTSLEGATCLSVNQASSIQSLGGTCESITIGHNKSKLPLSQKAIFLKSHRPLFLCEKVLDTIDAHDDLLRQRKEKLKEDTLLRRQSSKRAFLAKSASFLATKTKSISGQSFLDLSNSIRHAKVPRSSASLLGAYVNLEKDARKLRTQNQKFEQHGNIMVIVDLMIKEHQGIEHTRRVFNDIDSDGNGTIELEEFVSFYQSIDPSMSEHVLHEMFDDADLSESGSLTFDQFLNVAKMPGLLTELRVKNRDSRGLAQVQASRESYFGEELRKNSPTGVNSMAMSQSQNFSMELYESRVASMQRFVAMTVMFHQMGMRVQSFFQNISFGLLGYNIDRTHSIMRIATTASPVSGADVRERMEVLRLMSKVEKSAKLIARNWRKWKQEKTQQGKFTAGPGDRYLKSKKILSFSID